MGKTEKTKKPAWTDRVLFRPTIQNLLLMILMMGVNVGGHYLALALTLPLWLDTVGVMVVAILLGPLAGAIVGGLSVFLMGLIDGSSSIYVVSGVIVGLTRGSKRAHVCRAALEGIAYQVKDLLDAMAIDAGDNISVLRVDGGASVSNILMQFQCDMVRKPIDRPKMVETTAFGAAFLAGLAVGLWNDISDIASIRQSDKIFTPEMDEALAKKYHQGWLRAAERSLHWIEKE